MSGNLLFLTHLPSL